MGSYSELRELKEEEKILIQIASKFSDQLNRLKVEELALINQLRAKHDDESRSESRSEITDPVDDDKELDAVSLLEELDLAVNSKNVSEGDVEEMDDDGTAESEEDEDDLTALMRQINAHRNQYD